MSIQTIAKPECQTCGRKIPISGVRLSSIEFRRRVNDINTLDNLLESRDYLACYIKNKFRLREYVDNFLEGLEEMTDSYNSTADPIKEIEYIRIWIFGYINNLKTQCDLLNPEDSVYDHLRSNYSDINETFSEFYDNYAQFRGILQ